MPGRKYSSTTGLRYGFNGKEKDNKDGIVQYDYGFRIYDPRLVRFKSVDPMANGYPWYTPYQFAGNTPIQAIDLDGCEPKWMIDEAGHLTKPMITLLNAALNYDLSGMQKTKWKDSKTSYWAQTIFTTIHYNKLKNNYWETRNSNLWVDFWLDLVAHEQKHRNDYTVLGNVNFVTIYVLNGIYSLTTIGSFYDDKAILESRAYKIQNALTEILNFENGLGIKALESPILDETSKSEILNYVVASFQLKKANEKLNELKTSANADGKISKKESKKVTKAENKVKKLEEKVNQLNTEKVKAIRGELKNVQREPVKDNDPANNKIAKDAFLKKDS